MRDRIPIQKDLIPYSFDILLGAEMYEISIYHNSLSDRYLMNLSKDDEVLVYGEPLVYGSIMFDALYTRGGFPALQLEPWDESQTAQTANSRTLENTVFLTVYQGDDE